MSNINPLKKSASYVTGEADRLQIKADGSNMSAADVYLEQLGFAIDKQQTLPPALEDCLRLYLPLPENYQ